MSTPKDSILDGNKDNINIHYPGPQVLGWAACKCPLHCPGPSLLKAASRLSPQYPGRSEGGWVLRVEGAGPCSMWAKQGTSLQHTDLFCIVHWA
jgi:hypothetical protein